MRCPECSTDFQQRGYRFCPYDGTRLAHAKTEKSKASRGAGTVIADRYVVRGFIAHGAMAQIYMADDRQTAKLVAIKVLDKRKAENAEIRQRFLREAKAISALDHPNVVKIFEVGEEKGVPYIVMEMLRGESLEERLAVDKTVPNNIALAVLRQTASALWMAHNQGIVHRDIKPGNIYLIGDPKDPDAVRVIDFGLSRVFGSNLTSAGTVIGTPGYMAPEQVVGDPVDQRSDVYALGMVMYRMFTGELPFKGKDDVTILAKHLFATPTPPTMVASDLDPQVEAVIMRAIRKRPENRYPSMQLFGEDIRKLKAGAKIGVFDVGSDKYELTEETQLVAAGYKKLMERRS